MGDGRVMFALGGSKNRVLIRGVKIFELEGISFNSRVLLVSVCVVFWNFIIFMVGYIVLLYI